MQSAISGPTVITACGHICVKASLHFRMHEHKVYTHKHTLLRPSIDLLNSIEMMGKLKPTTFLISPQ